MPTLASELDVVDILGTDGIIGEQIDGFNPRQSQLGMANLIYETIASSDSQIIEASTGIG